MIKAALSSIIDYILPYRCSACTELTDQANGICADCFQKINFISEPYCDICGFPFEFHLENRSICAGCIALPPKYDLNRSLFRFDENSKKIVHSFKYGDKTNYAKIFAKLLVARYKNELEDVDMIVPIPMNRFKRIFRHYNPPQILSDEIAKLLNKKMIPDLLIKKKWTKSQTGLTKSQRGKNLQGSIIICSKYNVKNKVILLVDDVKSTGTTSNLCSSIIKKSGAKFVKLVTIALN